MFRLKQIVSLCVRPGRAISFTLKNGNNTTVFAGPRTLCTQKKSQNSLLRDWISGASVGLFKGAFGAMVGLGGGVVAIPLLVSLSKLTQHQAHGTSLPGVLVSGAAGALTYWTFGGGENSVDIPAAILLATSAMAFTPLGAKLANKIPGNYLSFLLGSFMVILTPLVLLKSYFQKSTVEEPEENVEPLWNSIAFKNSRNFFLLGGIGIATGLASGMFGVGGGVVMVPLLSMLANQQLALGTSLLAMIGPSAVGTLVHYRLGNVYLPVVPPLLVGSAIGAFLGGKLSVNLTEQQQRLLFAVIMSIMSAKSLAGIRKPH